ncbi:lipopolysaccharide biosynthesis protein [Pseudomonas sp. TE3786]
MPYSTRDSADKKIMNTPTEHHLLNQPAPARLIAFYLTQFHPTAENDKWWGKGFTEWTNVTKAEPLYEGHYQPHLPTDFGFYDLRLRDTRRDQIKTAKEYGVDGFCYHYYWFSGKRILNQPLDDMLADPQSDMPFCLCWANENWTRRWDGADHEILIAQQYLPTDDVDFIKSLVPIFEDPRYIRVDGKPLLIVYRHQHLPDPSNTLKVWRDYCREIGLGEIHLCAALTHGNENYQLHGFDSGVEFPPHNLKHGNANHEVEFHKAFAGTVMRYEAVANSYLDRDYKDGRVFKTVFPSWDNTARTNNRALVVLNGTPDNYECWLSETLDLQQAHTGENLVFINAWNEWAEGCHLEPDRKYGHGFLQATLNAKQGVRRFSRAAFPHTQAPMSGQQRRGFFADLAELAKFHGLKLFSRIKEAIKRVRVLHRLLLPFVRTFRRFMAKLS